MLKKLFAILLLLFLLFLVLSSTSKHSVVTGLKTLTAKMGDCVALSGTKAQRHKGTKELSIADCQLSIENSNNQPLTTNNLVECTKYNKGNFLNFLSENISSSIAMAKEKLVFTAHFSSSAGTSAAAMLDIFETIVNKMEKNLDTEIEINRASSAEEAFENFLTGSAQATSIWVDSYSVLKEKNIKVVPISTYTVDNAETRDICLYSAKGKTIDYNNLSDKIIAFTYHSPIEYYASLRAFLLDKGIDKPLYEVFGGFLQIPNPNSAFYAIGTGQLDFYWENSDYQTTLKFMSKSVYNKLNVDNCFDINFPRGTIVIRENKFPKAENFKKNFWASWDDLKKTDTYKKYVASFKMLKLNITLPSKDLFEKTYPFYQKAKSKGWLKEAEFLKEKMKNIPSGQIYKYEKPKKTFDECKRECTKSKNTIQCLEKCMK